MIQIHPDAEYLHRLRIELEKNLRPYKEELAHILSVMPVPGFVVYEDGRIEPLPPYPVWQSKIDRVQEVIREYTVAFYKAYNIHIAN